MIKPTLYFILFYLNAFYTTSLTAQKNDTISLYPLKTKQMKTYSDKDLIIKLQKTPGMPNSIYYNLEIYGDGNYAFTGSSKRIDDYSLANDLALDSTSEGTNKKELKAKKDNAILTKAEIETILTKAKGFIWEDLTLSKIPQKAIIASCDRQLIIFSIWINGSLRNIEKGFLYKDKETAALADYILSLVEN